MPRGYASRRRQARNPPETPRTISIRRADVGGGHRQVRRLLPAGAAEKIALITGAGRRALWHDAGAKRSSAAPARGESDVNYVLVMKNAQAELVAIGPVAIEYQAAMLRDRIEESADWTAVGIARVLTEAQARSLAGLPPQPGGAAQPAATG
jgi:hypothetical protein